MTSTKPNVLLIMADDVGWFDVGAYHRGIMGTKTPNIDRIAAQGALLTDCYAQASCTAGRAAFITGQLPIRTGLTAVGLPGAPVGIQPEDPTLAELIIPEGYRSAQIGKNHLGDRNEFMPTAPASFNPNALVDAVLKAAKRPMTGSKRHIQVGADNRSRGPVGLVRYSWVTAVARSASRRSGATSDSTARAIVVIKKVRLGLHVRCSACFRPSATRCRRGLGT